MTSHPPHAGVPSPPPGIASATESLGGRLASLIEEIKSVLNLQLPELGADRTLMDLLGDSIAGNLEIVLHILRHDIAPENVYLPATGLEHVRRIAQHGIPVHALIRAYRLAHDVVLNAVLTELERSGPNSKTGLPVVRHVVTTLATYLDRSTRQIAEVYQLEQETWVANRGNTRRVLVREVLNGGADAEVGDAIGYQLRQNHLGLILWTSENAGGTSEQADLEQVALDLSTNLARERETLFVAVDRTTGWAWLPLGSSRGTGLSETIRGFMSSNHRRVSIAVGRPGHGTAGFRTSHEQAEKAKTIALIGAPSKASITAFDDPGIGTLALLTHDVSQTRAWVGEVLGDLARDTDAAARLRKTLKVYLENGSSNVAAGKVLHLHYNSVKYRIKKAATERGRTIGPDRVDVELALLACHWLGSAVLSGQPTPT